MSIPDDKFSDYIQPDLLVRNRLNHSNRNDVEERDDQREDEPLHRELCLPDLNADDTTREHAQEDDGVPPLGHLGVSRHEPCVNIRLFVHRSARLRPDLFAEVEEGMRERSGDGREGETVRYGEGRRDEERTVCRVGFLIEGRVRVYDLLNIVWLCSVVVGSST